MAVRVAINGFGRIGRLVLRSIIEHDRKDIEVVSINDLGPVATNAHLLQYDSVHGRLNQTVEVDGDTIIVGDRKFLCTAVRDPADLPHAELDIDIAMECTGIFADKEKTIVFGVNHDTLTKDDLVVSNASCTTNCLSPVAKVLNDTVGIKRGYMTTVHSYTGDQPTLDRMHKDLYRGRAAAMSMIPTSTGAAKAVGLVLPELKGKLDGSAIRVPTPNVSMIDLVFDAGKPTTVEEVNTAIKAAADGPMKGVLGYTDKPLVSADFNHDPHSSTFALDQTQVIEGTMVRVLSWYDNEWGFATRMSDTALAMSKLI